MHGGYVSHRQQVELFGKPKFFFLARDLHSFGNGARDFLFHLGSGKHGERYAKYLVHVSLAVKNKPQNSVDHYACFPAARGCRNKQIAFIEIYRLLLFFRHHRLIPPYPNFCRLRRLGLRRRRCFCRYCFLRRCRFVPRRALSLLLCRL